MIILTHQSLVRIQDHHQYRLKLTEPENKNIKIYNRNKISNTGERACKLLRVGY